MKKSGFPYRTLANIQIMGGNTDWKHRYKSLDNWQNTKTEEKKPKYAWTKKEQSNTTRTNDTN